MQRTITGRSEEYLPASHSYRSKTGPFTLENRTPNSLAVDKVSECKEGHVV